MEVQRACTQAALNELKLHKQQRAQRKDELKQLKIANLRMQDVITTKVARMQVTHTATATTSSTACTVCVLFMCVVE